MHTIKLLWQENKPLVIVAVLVILALLYLIWKQNNGASTGTTTPDPNTPTTESEQLSTILAALGNLTPVTNTIQSAPVTSTISVTSVPQSVTSTTTVTQLQSITSAIQNGIGNDKARDAAIAAAEKKYSSPSQAAQLAAAIDAIKKQYPRSGTTIV